MPRSAPATPARTRGGGLDRRTFLGSLALLVTASVLLPASDRRSAGVRQASLVRSTFTPLVGATFAAAATDLRARVHLDEVVDLRSAPAGSEQGFVLRFRSATPLPDGIYTLTHPRFGRSDLFLAAVDRGAARRYEAVVNRLVV